MKVPQSVSISDTLIEDSKNMNVNSQHWQSLDVFAHRFYIGVKNVLVNYHTIKQDHMLELLEIQTTDQNKVFEVWSNN